MLSGARRAAGGAADRPALGRRCSRHRAERGSTASVGVPQTPTFKVQVDYVDVDVLVTDNDGRFVRDLTKDDFEVFEDGQPQTIANFSVVDIPIERADRPLYSPDAIRARRREQRDSRSKDAST